MKKTKERSGKKKVAILVANGFEQSELVEPRKALLENGISVDIVSPENSYVRGWNHSNWGDSFPINTQLDEAMSDDYDGLILPGGVMNPDALRMNRTALEFIREFFHPGMEKPVSAICHGAWPLIDAGVVSGRQLTSYPSLKADLMNAGARWVDQEVMVDGNLVTSRHPGDLPIFNQKTVEQLNGEENQSLRDEGSHSFAILDGGIRQVMNQ